LGCGDVTGTRGDHLCAHPRPAVAGTCEGFQHLVVEFARNVAGILTSSGLAVSGVDQDSEVRVVELPGDRFIIRDAVRAADLQHTVGAHPLISAYLAEAARTRAGAVAR
jgi:CTP synthase (UTP-ammonia lyase)